MEKNGKTSRCGQGSSEKSYGDKNRSDATGGCKSNPTRSAPRPDMCPVGNTMMMMILRRKYFDTNCKYSLKLLSLYFFNTSCFDIMPFFNVTAKKYQILDAFHCRVAHESTSHVTFSARKKNQHLIFLKTFLENELLERYGNLTKKKRKQVKGSGPLQGCRLVSLPSSLS